MAMDRGVSDPPEAFYWFDWMIEDMTYLQRMAEIKRWVSENSDLVDGCGVRVVVLYPEDVHDAGEIRALETKHVDVHGWEGLIARRPDGRYKHGRSTLRERLLLKLKRVEDAEAEVVGFTELVRKEDPEGASGLLGALVVRVVDNKGTVEEVPDSKKRKRESKTERVFRVGTGFGGSQRKALWESRGSLVGRIVKYRSAAEPNRDLPRFPVFMGFRAAEDLPDDSAGETPVSRPPRPI